MMQGLLQLTRPRRPDLQMRGTRFGSFFQFDAVPWLLLATVLRARAKTSPDDLMVFVYAACGELALFLAFLIASQKMIHLLGGGTSLDRLAFKEELRLAWAGLWRLNLLYLVFYLFAFALGAKAVNTVSFFLGFDGIVIRWPISWLPLWSAVIAALLFLFVVERGMDRKPKGHRVLLQLFRQIRYFLPAMVLLAGIYALTGEVQRLAANWIEPLYQMINANIRGLLLISFVFAFSYIRLLVTVYVLSSASRRFHLNASPAA